MGLFHCTFWHHLGIIGIVTYREQGFVYSLQDMKPRSLGANVSATLAYNFVFKLESTKGHSELFFDDCFYWSGICDLHKYYTEKYNTSPVTRFDIQNKPCVAKLDKRQKH